MASMAYSSIGIAFSAATIELFHYNEERMEVEGFSVIASLLGVVIGTFFVAMSLGQTTLLFPTGVVVGLISFFSMLGVPLMKEAKMPADKTALKGYFASLAECFQNKAFTIYFVAQFFDGMATQLLPLFYVVYLQFVCEANEDQRTYWLMAALAITLGTQLVMAPGTSILTANTHEWLLF
jgi:Na+/melibiose symporter-like transporter